MQCILLIPLHHIMSLIYVAEPYMYTLGAIFCYVKLLIVVIYGAIQHAIFRLTSLSKHTYIGKEITQLNA